MLSSFFRPLFLILSLSFVLSSCSKEDGITVLLPSVSTIEIFDITEKSAKCISEVDDDGGGNLISKGVCYGSSVDPTVNGSKTSDGTVVGSFLSKMENLESDKEYFIRAYATNEAGTSYGENISFRTSVIPKVSGDLILGSQEVIDLIFKSNVTVVEGDLYIGSESNWGDKIIINSLASMKSLKEVGGNLIIRNTKSLKNLEGLENIEKIGKSLTIDNNTDLTEINSLKNISSVVYGSLTISNNSSLETISGLNNIVRIRDNGSFSYGGVSIYNNSDLKNLEGLNNLLEIDEDLYISNNRSLGDIKALSGLTRVDDLSIINNDVLVNLEGLNNIVKIDGSLNISENRDLENIEALSSLTSIKYSLNLSYNSQIQSLKGLGNLEYGSYLNINIWDNYRLSDFCALKNAVSGMECSSYWWCNFYAGENAYNPELDDVKNDAGCKQ